MSIILCLLKEKLLNCQIYAKHPVVKNFVTKTDFVEEALFFMHGLCFCSLHVWLCFIEFLQNKFSQNFTEALRYIF